MKAWKETLDGLVALDYIRFSGVPMRKTKQGPVIDMDPAALEILAAKAVIAERIPIGGREVKFLRKAMGLSLEKFAGKLGLSSATIFHWEKAEGQRLAPVNEAAVRALAAEIFDVELAAKFSRLIGGEARMLTVKAG